MHKSIDNLIEIKKEIHSKNLDINSKTRIIAVSKTFSMEKILPLIDYGHIDFGENKVQEAVEKWSKILDEKKEINLHMIGKLQTNKVKSAVKLFDFIHSLDSIKLAKTAVKNKADYIAFGAFNFSKTKKIKYKASISLLKRSKKIIKTPIVAIGGINSKNYKKLLLNKANFLAISGYIWNNKKLKPIDAIKILK